MALGIADEVALAEGEALAVGLTTAELGIIMVVIDVIEGPVDVEGPGTTSNVEAITGEAREV